MKYLIQEIAPPVVFLFEVNSRSSEKEEQEAIYICQNRACEIKLTENSYIFNALKAKQKNRNIYLLILLNRH